MMAITMKIIATPAATMIGQYSKGAVVVVISGFNSNVSYEHRSKEFRALGASQSTTVARAANEAQYRSWKSLPKKSLIRLPQHMCNLGMYVATH